MVSGAKGYLRVCTVAELFMMVKLQLEPTAGLL